MYRFFYFLFFAFCFSDLSAQDNTGTWSGGGVYPPGQPISTVMRKMGAEKNLILHVNDKGRIEGEMTVAYDRSKASIDIKAANQSFLIAGYFDAARNLLMLTVTHVKPNKPGENNKAFLKPDTAYYSVALTKQADKMTMMGMINALMTKNASAEWIGSTQGFGLGMNVEEDIGMHLLPLRIGLEKNITAAVKKTATVFIPGKDTVAVLKQPSVKTETATTAKIETRKKEVQRTIVLDTSFIKLDMYDNGEIDGDIATLILDGQTIMANQLLSTKAASISLNLSKEPAEHILELFANNLGSIPPNTALVVLTCNRKRFEIYLSSTMETNGSVKLVFKSQK